MKYTVMALLWIGLLLSCSEKEEGLIGEWEGKTDRVNGDGELVEANVSCVIKSATGINRGVGLTVAGTIYEFNAIEELEELIYTDQSVQNDSTGRTYISGSAVLLNDTLLRFDHKIYAMKNGALLYSDKEMFDMVRK